jgi:hypothetical protein
MRVTPMHNVFPSAAYSWRIANLSVCILRNLRVLFNELNKNAHYLFNPLNKTNPGSIIFFRDLMVRVENQVNYFSWVGNPKNQ